MGGTLVEIPTTPLFPLFFLERKRVCGWGPAAWPLSTLGSDGNLTNFSLTNFTFLLFCLQRKLCVTVKGDGNC